ncbi:hypothetical protein [Porphyrobacter sp. LM 6]|nr:hypothetical protein [Porphyrobacter sp. LM 6]
MSDGLKPGVFLARRSGDEFAILDTPVIGSDVFAALLDAEL